MKASSGIINTFLLIFLSIILTGCGGTHQKNLKKLDEVYGVCDNPMRDLTKSQYEVCKMKEMGSGEGLEIDDLTTGLGELVSGMAGGGTIVSGSSFANKYLWQASLDVLSPFPIKIADNSGGYIETDWIIEYNEDKNKRCQIKVMIRSIELVSNGLKTTLNCQSYDSNNWNSDKITYNTEEKNITLRILEVAQRLSLEVN